MSDRPTPEQIAVDCEQESTHDFLAALRYHGYVIVHPDDYPRKVNAAGEDGRTHYSIGYNEALDDIFAAAEEPTP